MANLASKRKPWSLWYVFMASNDVSARASAPTWRPKSMCLSLQANSAVAFIQYSFDCSITKTEAAYNPLLCVVLSFLTATGYSHRHT